VLGVVLVDPLVEIRLEFIDACVHFLAKGHLVELVLDRAMKAFTDTVGLWMTLPDFAVSMSSTAKYSWYS
jgi:hypothetical protein